MSISPTEAWGLDYVELFKLADFQNNSSQDTSFAINAIRISNGCAKENLRNVNV